MVGRRRVYANISGVITIPTSAFFALVQNGGTRTVGRRVEHYDLDIIISVGYRVKSRQGV